MTNFKIYEANETLSLEHAQIKEAYEKSGRKEKFDHNGTVYKALERRQKTTFYDAAGSTLFDVKKPETEPAAKEGKETDKAEDALVKIYATGEEKLLAEEEEMLASVKPEFKPMMQAQFNLVFKELIEWVKADKTFEEKVLLSHKSMKRCMKYCTDQAMGIREPSDVEKIAARLGIAPIVTPVDDKTLFSWIKAYFDLDDKDAVEKEEAAKRPKTKKPAAKKSAKKKTETKTAEVPKAPVFPKTAPVFTPAKNKVDGQLSMFDLLTP